ncbi:MAG TPA: putative lipid II flippase FtsW [Opitutaceae bacterium]|nr:putative lipid II flippase FtsW [Opitutaceae bacterium]
MPSDPSEKPRWMSAFNPATIILVCVLVLSVLGLTVLFSASVSLKADPYFYLTKQVVWFAFAAAACFVVSRIDLEDARRHVWLFAVVCLVGLVLVLVPGIGLAVKGSRRWLGFGPARLQVSEFAKLAVVFGLAHYLALNQSRIVELGRGFLVPLAGIAGCAGLILLEPDFGTAALVFAIGVILLFLAGARLRYLVTSFAGAACLLAVAVVHNPNRLARLTAFMDVEGNRTAGTYQLWQAILAFAAGGVNGVGLGQGRQQNSFLPEVHTDFIFAVIGEELGLVFTLAVVALFAVIFIAGLAHLRKAPNLFQFLLVSGSLLLITLQALINLGVVTGCLPTKGMSLPFISAGGSNLVLMGVLVGILLNTQRAWTRPAFMRRERSLKEVMA